MDLRANEYYTHLQTLQTHLICLQKGAEPSFMTATARSPLQANLPWKLEIKVQVLFEHAARVSRETTQRTIYSKAKKMLTPISNSKNFCSASPSFRFSVCKHEVSFILCVQKAFNTGLKMIEHKQSARKPMLVHKRTPQGQVTRLQQLIPFSDASHNNTARIHLLFRFHKAFQTPHRGHAAQQPAATGKKSVQSRVHN